MNDIFAVRGDFYDCAEDRSVRVRPDSWCVVEDGRVAGVFSALPEKYRGIRTIDWSGQMIIPGMADLHTHAPQYGFRGMGMGLELLEWLETYTFPEEARYRDSAYADVGYQIFADDLRRSWTTRCVVFGSIFKDTTLLLMDKLEAAGLCCYVGKVSMDRNAPDYYMEETDRSIAETVEFIEEAERRYVNTKPILTPRFVPTCTDELLCALGELQKKIHIPAQSHLSENPSEIKWVQELCPKSRFYGDAYDQMGLFGKNGPVIMAHCVHSPEEEIELMRENGVYIAHCPGSNANLSSGIAPVRKFLGGGLRVGFGTDIAAGSTLSIPSEMVRCVQMSKMRWRYVEDDKPVSMAEAFFMATRGGGAFFGNVGCFDEGCEFDALVLDDSRARTPLDVTGADRLMRALYLYADCKIADKYVQGKRIDIN